MQNDSSSQKKVEAKQAESSFQHLFSQLQNIVPSHQGPPSTANQEGSGKDSSTSNEQNPFA
jgi:hypothetical protein